MKGHELSYRHEMRFARIDVPSNRGIESYPCLATCDDKAHHGGPQSHSGQNEFIYAQCACGWEQLVGTYIHEYEAYLQGRLAHIDHRMDVLAELGLFVHA